MTRIALVLLLSLVGCKKSPKPTVPIFPGAQQLPGGGNVELPEATVFHVILRTPDNASSVLRFYQTELEKRGAHRAGDVFEDDNLVHSGSAFMMDSTGTPKDPARPGVWLAVTEFGNETRIDILESVPKP